MRWGRRCSAAVACDLKRDFQGVERPRWPAPSGGLAVAPVLVDSSMVTALAQAVVSLAQASCWANQREVCYLAAAASAPVAPWDPAAPLVCGCGAWVWPRVASACAGAAARRCGGREEAGPKRGFCASDGAGGRGPLGHRARFAAGRCCGGRVRSLAAGASARRWGLTCARSADD